MWKGVALRNQVQPVALQAFWNKGRFMLCQAATEVQPQRAMGQVQLFVDFTLMQR